MKSIKEANIIKDSKIFVSSDLDVPIKDGKIEESFRLVQIIPTLRYIIDKGAHPVIAGHIGQPEGKIVPELSTQPLHKFFLENLNTDNFTLMENLRFDPGEELNTPEYAKSIAKNCVMFVNENFSTSHRKHASIVGVPKLIPGYAGIRFEQEINMLQSLTNTPKRPFIVIIGGAKIESKKPVIETFLNKADYVLLGGKLALEWPETIPSNLIVPIDYAEEKRDIGPETIKLFSTYISKAHTILWAGPMGQYEEYRFSLGSKLIAEVVASATSDNHAKSVIGGGDTITLLNKINKLSSMSFVSSGGGAMLNFLSNGTLPALEVLL